ncbi:hypothetical protein MBLNU459_g4206t1 [Dothideomycetes sp. NU459]
MKVVREEELGRNNTRGSCWIAVRGIVWDVTNFVGKHPGGANLILKVAGQDATEEYEEVHSEELIEETLTPQCRLGRLDPTTTPNSKKSESDAQNQSGIPPLSALINLNDFEMIARQTMKPTTWAYVSSGADDEISKTENRNAYSKVFLRGRVLKNVGTIDPSTKILGHRCSIPVYGSPVGLGKLVHPNGECEIASALGKEGLIQVVNTVSSMPIEAIMASRASPDQPVFWQLYLDKDLTKSEAFLKRVEKAGVQAIWLTVDSPVVGKREADDRSKAQTHIFDSIDVPTTSGGIAKAATSFINPSADWSIIKWLRSVTKLPIVIKGIQCVEDAVLAYFEGVEGIVLSNHGGRSQDTAQPPLVTLMEINRYAPHLLESNMEIFVDGGIRRGTDILKALALGATAVGIGRPVLHGMSAGYGESGIRRTIQILRDELQTNMAFVGATNVRELSRDILNTRKLEKLMTGSVKL